MQNWSSKNTNTVTGNLEQGDNIKILKSFQSDFFSPTK